eukprot:TRINITY_DN8631_c0_g1_i2.p1 TRINITY_DN8631_c0_g1~~TRINITY_DN8631_c0_g1_i2.p1  ORF type:complete len:246 (+),score=51.97 TRINITY_DN8631_c0_g1_i2:63-800(+)
MTIHQNDIDVPPEAYLNFPFCCSPWDRISHFLFSPLRICSHFFISYPKDLLRHVVRALQSNLSLTVYPSQDEIDMLRDKEGIEGKYVIKYLVWRRSSLYLVILPLLARILMVLCTLGPYPSSSSSSSSVQNSNNNINPNNPLSNYSNEDKLLDLQRLLWGVSVAVAALQLISVVLYTAAAYHWCRFKLSRKLLRAAWLLYFFSPFLISLLPYYKFIEVKEGVSLFPPPPPSSSSSSLSPSSFQYT